MMDESVHGAFSSYIFVRDMAKASEETRKVVTDYINKFISELYSKVDALLNYVYTEKEIIEDIKRFANYNFNRTLRSLNFAEVFKEEDTAFHPLLKAEVEKGLEVTHDIFDLTGNVYFMIEHEDFTEKNLSNIEREITHRSPLAPKLLHG